MTTQPIDASLLREDEREVLERAEKSTPGPWAASGTVECDGDGCTHCWHTFDKQADVLPSLGEAGPVAIAAQNEYDNAGFIAHARTDVPELLRRLIEERGRANRFDDALTRIIGLCAPNSKRGTHPRLDKVFGRMMDIDCQARHPEEWEKANPLPAPPEKGKKL